MAMAIAHFSRLIVKQPLLFLSQAGIRLECSHSYTLLRHVSAGKKQVFKVKDSTCQLLKFKTVAKSLMKWVWISVNSSWIGLVGQRHEKLVGHSKLFPYVCFSETKNNNKLLRNP